ncbi:MAG: HNH endonuclease domain-containing protein [Elusimicrobiales bacterium]|nr:HNH endonuclease domain-containing protein [Elusimicrobiales bacterium]
MSDNLIFSFDIGTGSLGECVRRGDKTEHLDSLLMPPELASTKEARDRRHLIRTHLAHHKRENWWRQCAGKAGIEVLETRQPIYEPQKDENGRKKRDANGYLITKLKEFKPDPRMLYEFAPKNNVVDEKTGIQLFKDMIYTSCLLRIALLQSTLSADGKLVFNGKPLESWQVFKAVWSALQHRGYDKDVPWKTGATDDDSDKKFSENDTDSTDSKENDEEKNKKLAKKYEDYFQKNAIPKECWLPCYYEAHILGLWNKDTGEIKKRDSSNAQSKPARNSDKKGVAPRKFVADEIRRLLDKARKQYDKLPDTEYIMYGEGRFPYPSMNKKNKDPNKARLRGLEIEAEAILGQKVPRFDNRIISKCCLIPRLNVCKAKDMGNREVQFLLALLNIRYQSEKPDTQLNVDQLKQLFVEFQHRLKDEDKNGNLKSTITASDWGKWVKEKLNGSLAPGHTHIPAPQIKGRSRFCRKALELLKELILSGKDPKPFHDQKLAACTNTDVRKGLIAADYQRLLETGNDWHSIHIPDHRTSDAAICPEQRENKISEIINSVNNPVVRHRLGFLVRRLKALKVKGIPDNVVLEFVRSDFKGKKAKQKYEEAVENNRKENLEARENGFAGNIRKYRLYKEQSGVDMYEFPENDKPNQAACDSYNFSCQPKLPISELASYHIDHIVPRAHGGSDDFCNLILTSENNNTIKSDKTPYQWLYEGDATNAKHKWKAFCARVEKSNLSDRKKKILCSKNPKELIKDYTQLAETAHIAKLAQRIICIFFGWPQGTKDSERKVIVSNGKQTHYVRKFYKLDRLLHPTMSNDDFEKLVTVGLPTGKTKKTKRGEVEVIASLDEKNRDNPRHHALDALVLSMQPEIACGKNNKDGLRDEFVERLERNVTRKENEEGHIFTLFCKRALEGVKPRQAAFVKPVLAGTLHGIRRKEGECYLVTRYSLKKRGKHLEQVGGTMPIGPNAEFPTVAGEHTIAKMPKQYIRDKKEHKGYLICRPANSKRKKVSWQIEPVYVWETKWQKMRKVSAEKVEGIAKYDGVSLFLRSKELIKLESPCPIPNGIIDAGTYRLKTITSKGDATIETVDALKEYSTKINNLMNVGKMQSVQKKPDEL